MPPFPSRERDESNPNEAPKEHYTPEEAASVKETLFTQLDGFEACVPYPYIICRRPLMDYAQRPLRDPTPRRSLCEA